MTYATIEQRKWGTAEIIENNELYCGKILKIKKGYRMSLQYHKLKDETLYVLTGQILVEYEKEFTHKIYKEVLRPGERIRISPLRLHRVTGLTDADIIVVSTQSEDNDSYHIEDGGKVPE
jgi:mannose-6-phosphate isomerase-like protein (cupin superfamily)